MQVRFSSLAPQVRFGIKTDDDFFPDPKTPSNNGINPTVFQNLAAAQAVINYYKSGNDNQPSGAIFKGVAVALEPLYTAVNQMAQDLYNKRP